MKISTPNRLKGLFFNFQFSIYNNISVYNKQKNFSKRKEHKMIIPQEKIKQKSFKVSGKLLAAILKEADKAGFPVEYYLRRCLGKLFHIPLNDSSIQKGV